MPASVQVNGSGKMPTSEYTGAAAGSAGAERTDAAVPVPTAATARCTAAVLAGTDVGAASALVVVATAAPAARTVATATDAMRWRVEVLRMMGPPQVWRGSPRSPCRHR